MMAGKLKYGVFFILTVISVSFFSCAKTQSPQNNGTVNQANQTPVNVTVLLSSHPSLSSQGGIDSIPNVGIKGIIICRAVSSTEQYYAYERSCTYDGTTVTKAKVYAVSGNFTCKDNVCGSVFTIADGSGGVRHGPATYPLKQYTVTQISTNELHITN
jgi:Rieske Fe-S protein